MIAEHQICISMSSQVFIGTLDLSLLSENKIENIRNILNQI